MMLRVDKETKGTFSSCWC